MRTNWTFESFCIFDATAIQRIIFNDAVLVKEMKTVLECNYRVIFIEIFV